MKKKVKAKGKDSIVTILAKSDVADLVGRMYRQLLSIENKIDALMGRYIPRSTDAQVSPKPNNGSLRERPLFKAICADCGNPCEVPFKPSDGRPVYCKECFAKRRNRGSFKPVVDNKPKTLAEFQSSKTNKPSGAESRKPAGKKRPAVKTQRKERYS